MKNITIIGGGASGLIAAIYASKNKENKVTILERNKECGKKILATGNGKCNYWNQDQSIKHYHSKNINLLEEILTEDNQKEILDMFSSLGIIPKIKNGYYYPFSNQATTIKNALVNEVQRNNIIIKNDTLVQNIKKANNKFIIETENEIIESDKIIIATGSYAAPKTGSTGMGYDFLKKFNHTIIKPLPALVQLKANENYLKEWQGIRTDVIISLYENNKKITAEEGEIQLTNYGISGICTFNLSHYVTRGLYEGKNELIKINFLPFLKYNKLEEYLEWFEHRNNNIAIYESLSNIINNKLASIILKQTGIKEENKWKNFSYELKRKLIENLISFPIKITDTNTFNEAQVANGGIPLTEINIKTMESKKEQGLYIIGELLDVAGDCGGYNLTFAWISGMLAGKNI